MSSQNVIFAKDQDAGINMNVRYLLSSNPGTCDKIILFIEIIFCIFCKKVFKHYTKLTNFLISITIPYQLIFLIT